MKLLCELQQLFNCWHVFDDLARLGADADVAKVRDFVLVLVAVIGDIDQGFEHPGNVMLGGLGEVSKVTHGRDVFAPTRHHFVDGLEGAAINVVAWHVVDDLAGCVLISNTDLQLALPVAGVAEGVELVEDEVLIAAVAQGIAFLNGVIPAHHALAACGGTEFDLAQLCAERVVEVDLGNKYVCADLSVVGLAATDVVDRLRRDASGLEELGRKSVRCGDVGREAVTLIEPVGLAEFTDDVVAFVLSTEDELAHVSDLRSEDLTCGPIDVDQGIEVEREWFVAGEDAEVEFGCGKGAAIDDLFVGACFSPSQCVEESIPALGSDLADVLDDA